MHLFYSFDSIFQKICYKIPFCNGSKKLHKLQVFAAQGRSQGVNIV